MELMTIAAGRVNTSGNYRRRFSNMDEFTESIRKNGIRNPPKLRIFPGTDTPPKLVAGGKRIRAFISIHGPEAELQYLGEVMTDEQELIEMVVDNKDREDPSAVEEAEHATKMLGICRGDKAETARKLGYSVSTLDRRLALMNAIEEVRTAYLEDQIELGHLEVLAGLRKEVQTQVLEAILKAPTKPTVSDLVKMVQQAMLSLDSAIFNKKDCQGCKHNTVQQQAMFETSIAGSNCTNKECFDKKTEDELELRADALRETYQVVRIVRAGENNTVVPLRAEGQFAVGKDQAEKCRVCGDFGACISAAPDKLGKDFREMCFNTECNEKMVAAYKKVVAEQAAPKSSKPEQGQEGAKGTSTKAKPEGQAGSATGTGEEPPVTRAEVVPRNQIREYRENVWRLVFQAAVPNLPPQVNRSILIALCLLRPSCLDSSATAKALKDLLKLTNLRTTDALDLMTVLMKLDQPALFAALNQLPAHVSVTLEIGQIVKFLQAANVQLENFWMVDTQFFAMLNKNEIDIVAKELGIDTALGAAYAKAKNGGKDDYVKAVSTIPNFEYKGKIPSFMRW